MPFTNVARWHDAPQSLDSVGVSGVTQFASLGDHFRHFLSQWAGGRLRSNCRTPCYCAERSSISGPGEYERVRLTSAAQALPVGTVCAWSVPSWHLQPACHVKLACLWSLSHRMGYRCPIWDMYALHTISCGRLRLATTTTGSFTGTPCFSRC